MKPEATPKSELTEPQVCRETGLVLTSASHQGLHHSAHARSFHQGLRECCYALYTTEADSNIETSINNKAETCFTGWLAHITLLHC